MSEPRTTAGRWPEARAAVVDAMFLAGLGVTALAGLASTYTGWAFLAVGVVGLLLGIGVATGARLLGWPLVAPVLLATALFYLLGGALTLRSAGRALPTPDAWRQLTDQALFGWKDLLTTLPPVDGSGPLLVLPWALGLATGVVGAACAGWRWGPGWLRSVIPLLPPAGLLALIILLGVTRPQSLWVQGVGFAVLGLGWLTVRGQRVAGSLQGHAGRGSRLVAGAALIGLAGLLALPVATFATGNDHDRLLLRPRVEPPFDIGQYPSPLASFRRYVDMGENPTPENRYDKTLFTIAGVPAGTRVRFATLDRYDGVVWGAANNTIPGAVNDTYQRVSSTIDNPVPGTTVRATVTVADAFDGVWLPVAGALQSLRFTTGDIEAKADSFRYNLAASTAVVPSGLRPGDRYDFTAVLPDDRLAAETLASGDVGAAGEAGAFLDTQAREWSAEQATPMAAVFAIAHHLRDEGRYTDGVTGSERVYPAGHYVGRLSDGFVNDPMMAGNDEQYAATMALLANRVGVPARVVMGALVPEGGVVTGADVQAWVEVQAADGSWRTLPTEEFMGDRRPAKLPPQNDRDLTGATVPPAAPIPPPSAIQDQTDTKLKARKGKESPEEPEPAAGLPAWVARALVYGGIPLTVVGALLSSILVVKVWRRRRRRRRGPASARFDGAWRELVDHARDLGQEVPVSAVTTRREQSAVIVSSGAPGLAREADAKVFGPTAPDAGQAETFWSSVDAERRSMSEAVGRARRWRARVSLASFRGRNASTLGS